MCLFPMPATIPDFGKPIFHPDGVTLLPCGKYFECLAKRAIDWALRARHEISCHPQNCFLTLTYDNDNLPQLSPQLPEQKNREIFQYQFQNFLKKLRRRNNDPIRYMVAHEYGSTNYRPHHHCLLFGYNPPNQKLDRYSPSGEPLFRSPDLEKLWTHGFSSIGTANEKTAYYIANYALKGSKHNFPDTNTGEIITVSDFMKTSNRPAIGKTFFEKNIQALINSDLPLPRYYIKQLEKNHPLKFEQYQNNQLSKIKNRSNYELNAKYIITRQKNNSTTEFRDISTDVSIKEKFHAEYLQHNANTEHYITLQDKK